MKRKTISLNPKMQFLLVFGIMIFFIALATGYGGTNPALMGHSPGEVELVFEHYYTDCESNTVDEPCTASCLPREVAVSGNCISDDGFIYQQFGLNAPNEWECFDYTHREPDDFVAFSKYKAEVICLKVGN